MATFHPLLHSLLGVGFVVIFFLGGRKMISGTMTIGAFVAFQFYLGRMVWPLIALGWVINLVQRGMASMTRPTASSIAFSMCASARAPGSPVPAPGSG